MAKGYFLGFGLASVNPNYYQGWSGKLDGTVPDIKLFSSKLKEMGYVTKQILTKKATIDSFKTEINKIAAIIKPEDILVITYSGHGGQVTDLNKDEKDRLDETFCLYDGEITDDYIYEVLSILPKCRVVFFADSCHSGSAYKLIGNNKIAKFRPASKQSKVVVSSQSIRKLTCSLKYFGGCQDYQLSADLGTNGLFTKSLWETVDLLRSTGNQSTWINFYNTLYKHMPSDQKPTYVKDGTLNNQFEVQDIFKI